MKRSFAALAAAFALAGTVTSCSSDTVEPAAAVEAAAPVRVGVEEFAQLVATPGVQIIDVRTPEEFADGHIAGAVNIPVESSDFRDRVSALNPAGTYAVYCRSGNRSQGAVETMAGAGITGIYELESGTVGWTGEGLDLVR